jgi:hypothetical protein
MKGNSLMKSDVVRNAWNILEIADDDLRMVCGGLGATIGNDAIGVQGSSQSQNGLLNLLEATIQAVANVPIDNATSGVGSLRTASGENTSSTRTSGED